MSSSDKSESSQSSSSPAPNSPPRKYNIPNESMIIEYNVIDPTDVLDNPRNVFGTTFNQYSVNEKTASIFVDLLLKYQQLSQANMELNVKYIKHMIQLDDFKTDDVYDLLDKFYTDIPQILPINANFLNTDRFKMFISKKELHDDIKDKLVKLDNLLKVDYNSESKTDNSQSYKLVSSSSFKTQQLVEPESESEPEPEPVLEPTPPVKETKKRGKKALKL